MPDLSIEGVHQFWKDYEDPIIYRVVSFMEGVEDWPYDGDPQLEEAMLELSKELDTIGNYELGNNEHFINICNYLRSGRALRFLQVIDTAHPGAASKLLIYAEENSQSEDDANGLFLRRNVVFERLRLLSRVFSRERFNLISRALEGDDV